MPQMYASNVYSSCIRSYPSASVVLPSFLKRRSVNQKESRKKSKQFQSWDRDIICLPKDCGSLSNIPYPRGKYRAKLGSNGLIGKIRLNSSMSVDEVEEEVRSVFQKAMGGRKDFQFIYLQPTGAGSRTLTVPTVSSSFSWTAQQVVKLAANKQTVYILANDELDCKVEVK